MYIWGFFARYTILRSALAGRCKTPEWQHRTAFLRRGGDGSNAPLERFCSVLLASWGAAALRSGGEDRELAAADRQG